MVATCEQRCSQVLDIQQTQTQDSILSSISVLHDPRNIGVAFGISLVSCIRDETYVISYPLPVNGRLI